MKSDIYKQLRNEFYEKNKSESLSKRQVILLEMQIRKDLPQKCIQCERTNNLTLDHIISKTILEDLGVNTTTTIIEDNYQILCGVCNRFKSGHLDIRNPKTKEILLRLLTN